VAAGTPPDRPQTPEEPSPQPDLTVRVLGADGEPAKPPATESPLIRAAKVVGAVAGAAAWVQFVGAVVLGARLDTIGVPPTATVGLFPRDASLLFALGVRALVGPLFAGMVALGLLLLLNPGERSEEDPRQSVLCRKDRAPSWLRTILVAVVVAAAIRAIALPLSTLATVVMIGLAILTAVIVYAILERTETRAAAAWTLFVSVAIFGGALGLAREVGERPDLDVGVVLRKDGSAIGGFYIGRTGDTLYLVTTVRPAGNVKSRVAGGSPGAAPVPNKICRGARAIADRKSNCYVEQLVGIPSDQVLKFALGPRGVRVNENGYSAARVLAQVALLKRDEERLQTQEERKPPACTISCPQPAGRG
jgi:hypothetical protein